LNDRRLPRVPLKLEVEYRTTGAFLVAYSVNLSTGGIFLETELPPDEGTELTLKFLVPGSELITIKGEVAWTREESTGQLPPFGMGIRFVQPAEEELGEIIDRIVSGFKGLKVVVVAPTAQVRSQLARTVRSMLASAAVVEVADSDKAEVAFFDDADLAVIDLDDAGPEGLLALRVAKMRGDGRPIPVIVAARDDEGRIRARELGADEIVANPPAFADFQSAVLRAIGKPSRVGG
jgi:uncharacterized protein (TIGR02266 family)